MYTNKSKTTPNNIRRKRNESAIHVERFSSFFHCQLVLWLCHSSSMSWLMVAFHPSHAKRMIPKVKSPLRKCCAKRNSPWSVEATAEKLWTQYGWEKNRTKQRINSYGLLQPRSDATGGWTEGVLRKYQSWYGRMLEITLHVRPWHG